MDGLSKQLGGPDHPAIGFALGVERLITLVQEESQEKNPVPDLFIIGLGEGREALFPSAVLACLIAAGWISVRYIPFLVFLQIPLALPLIRPLLPRIPRRLAGLAAALLLCGLAVSAVPGLRHSVLAEPAMDRFFYPQRLTQFMKEHGITGRVFNSYELGGFLSWYLHPDIRIFIDGRGLIPAVFAEYAKLLSGDATSAEGEPFWTRAFREYGVRHALLIPFNEHGGFYAPLAPAPLPVSPDWLPAGRKRAWQGPLSPMAHEHAPPILGEAGLWSLSCGCSVL